MPLIRNRGTYRSKSNFLSTRSDSEPTMCLSLTPQSVRRPSIVLTRASVEQEARWNGSIGSRLPSHLSLGSTDLSPTPAPTTPMSLFNDRSFPPNRSVTPILFPEHQLNQPSTYSTTRCTSSYLSPSPSTLNLSPQNMRHGRALSKSQLNLRRKMNNFLSPSGSSCSLSGKGSSTNLSKHTRQITQNQSMTTNQYLQTPTINTPSLMITEAEPDNRERKVMTGVIKEWTRQTSLETRV